MKKIFIAFITLMICNPLLAAGLAETINSVNECCSLKNRIEDLENQLKQAKREYNKKCVFDENHVKTECAQPKCNDGSIPDINGCCTEEVYEYVNDFGTFLCCSKDGGDCRPPVTKSMEQILLEAEQ